MEEKIDKMIDFLTKMKEGILENKTISPDAEAALNYIIDRKLIEGYNIEYSIEDRTISKQPIMSPQHKERVYEWLQTLPEGTTRVTKPFTPFFIETVETLFNEDMIDNITICTQINAIIKMYTIIKSNSKIAKNNFFSKP